MAQSLSSILVHLIFSTEHREPLVTATLEPALHSYMAGILKRIHCPAITIGRMPDRVHVLFTLARTASISDVVDDVKKDWSSWVKTQDAALSGFCWQGGYAAFSVGASAVEAARKYFDDQREHHRLRTFQDEVRVFLKRYNVSYDERYVRD